MQITRLDTIFVSPGEPVSFGSRHRNWIFVKVSTDSGLHGIGEAFETGHAKSVESAVSEFSRWLIGEDPTRIVRNWQALYRGLRYPLGTVTLSALSAIEHALWDISGKACGLPVYKMLGGPARDRMRAYASPVAFPGVSLVDDARTLVDLGFSAVKFVPQPDDYARKTSQVVLAESVARVRSVREAVGDEIDICIDYHGRSFSPAEAIAFARAVEPYRPFFLEEPALSENPDSLVEIKSKTAIPIAAGERAVTRESMRALIDRRAVHIVQPEPTANGGLLETVKLAAMAEYAHVMVAPHHAASLVALAVCAHIDAAVPNFLIQEVNLKLDSQVAREVIVDPPKLEAGYLTLPDKPGLGVELNEEAAKDYPYQPFDRRVVENLDGSIGLY